MEEYILEARKYFKFEDWSKLDHREQLKYGQITYIYFACIHLGIEAVAPEFMCTWKQEKVQKVVPVATTIEEKKLIFLCEYCDCTFALKEYVVKHRKICRKRFSFTKKKTYVCDQSQCNYTTHRIENLDRHKASTHSNKRKYSCNFCAKTFKHKQSLNVHVNIIHLKVEKGYKCSACPYQTHVKGNLERHMNTHGLIQKGYACTQCLYRTNFKGALVRHSKIHTKNHSAVSEFARGESLELIFENH